MDVRLLIEPWKMELVERHFKDLTVSKEPSPLCETEVSGFHGSKSCLSCPLISTFSSPVVRICRPKLISKLKNSLWEEEDDVTCSSPEPDFKLFRPKIIKDERKFPIKRIVQDEKDQGRNCVSVILKSRSSTLAAKISMKLSERIRVVEELSSKYPVKYDGKSENSKRTEARLDFCFHSAIDARHFFGKVNDLLRGGGRQMVSVIMYAEESLGRFASVCSLLSIFYLKATSIHQS